MTGLLKTKINLFISLGVTTHRVLAGQEFSAQIALRGYFLSGLVRSPFSIHHVNSYFTYDPSC